MCLADTIAVLCFVFRRAALLENSVLFLVGIVQSVEPELLCYCHGSNL